MKIIHFFILILIFSVSKIAAYISHYDLTVVSPIVFADGIGRLGLGFIDTLKDDLSINHINSRKTADFTDINQATTRILKGSDKSPGNVAILFDCVWIPIATPTDLIPKTSLIKIAYSMWEYSHLPKRWVTLLNGQFDLVVVPDESIKTIYINSGVRIPIFVVPFGVYIENLLVEPLKKAPSKPFTFGSPAGFWPRKNQDLLIEAFYQEFGNSPDVKLSLHGRASDKKYFETIQKKIKSMRPQNITIGHDVFTLSQYKNFLKTLDCMVVLSRGEGFSIPPREALALGIPCIISNNTAHETICRTGLFCSVPSLIAQPATMPSTWGFVGHEFNCSIHDVRKALRDVYENYNKYLEKAEKGRAWVEQYLWQNMKKQFINLVKPKEILYGNENKITDEFFMTDSLPLYEKYALLAGKNVMSPK